VSVFKTTDIGLAAYLKFKGCQDADVPFEHSTGSFNNPVLSFCFKDVDTNFVTEYMNDELGMRRYNGARRFLLGVVRRELGVEPHDR
jgi:hypothetical protein